MKYLGHDQLYYPYPAKRVTTFARKGMVATSQPLAAQAGLEILRKGGNAIDAAIATAACLTVVEPTSNGIGGDAFALIWTDNNLYGLNSSGPAPGNISLEKVKNAGYQEIPKTGWYPVTVPGIPAAWAELSERFGKLPLLEVLKPAIAYALEGYPVSPTLGKYWHNAYQFYHKELTGNQFNWWFKTFAPAGKPPAIGEIWSSPGHARTLRLIGETDSKAFYQGELAAKIDQFSDQFNGFLSGDDLASFEPEWVEPVKVNYNGYDIWELPPNGQGLITLIALNILKEIEINRLSDVDRYHHQIEALKLAFVDGKEYITDSQNMSVRVQDFLSDKYASKRRQMITEQAIIPKASKPQSGGTVYLATADAEGNMVSYIQSNYLGFGSGLVVPGTGIALQNRGHSFSLDPAAANRLEPGKRPYHTIIPGFLTYQDIPLGPFGVMGGFMQPQGHLQVVINMLDFGLNPQAALDAPRWQWVKDKEILVEPTFPQHIAEALARKGHKVKFTLDSGSFGRGQIILRNSKTGVYYGGTESRTDGAVIGY